MFNSVLNLILQTASTYPEPEDKEAFIRSQLYDYNYDGVSALPARYVQKRRKVCGLGCVNRMRASARVTQPSPHIFLHVCTAASDLGQMASACADGKCVISKVIQLRTQVMAYSGKGEADDDFDINGTPDGL